MAVPPEGGSTHAKTKTTSISERRIRPESSVDRVLKRIGIDPQTRRPAAEPKLAPDDKVDTASPVFEKVNGTRLSLYVSGRCAVALFCMDACGNGDRDEVAAARAVQVLERWADREVRLRAAGSVALPRKVEPHRGGSSSRIGANARSH